MLFITKHARQRLLERYNIGYDEINPKELYELLEENTEAGLVRYKDTVTVNIIYRNQLIKAVYNPKLTTLVTVNPINEEKRLKLDK